MNIIGKVALITGAGQGIGQAIAKQLASHGVAIAVNDINAETAEQTVTELTEAGHRAVAVVADVDDPEAVNAMVAQAVAALGEIDILVNNAAGPGERQPFVGTTLQTQRDEMSTLMGVMHCTRAVLPAMIDRRQGRVINILSITGSYGLPGRAIYSAAKAGIDGFIKAVSAEVGQYGITINGVSPGSVDSPRFLNRSEDVREAQKTAISLNRIGLPADVANAVVFLASDMAGYITGTTIDVDGGFRGFMPMNR